MNKIHITTISSFFNRKLIVVASVFEDDFDDYVDIYDVLDYETLEDFLPKIERYKKIFKKIHHEFINSII